MNNEPKIINKFNLEERTAKFGEEVIKFSSKVPQGIVTSPLTNQLVRSGTSVGANYCEADDAESKSDFKHKIGICKKEARESKHWLRMIAVAVPELTNESRILWQEAKELNLIFNAITKKLKSNVS